MFVRLSQNGTPPISKSPHNFPFVLFLWSLKQKKKSAQVYGKIFSNEKKFLCKSLWPWVLPESDLCLAPPHTSPYSGKAQGQLSMTSTFRLYPPQGYELLIRGSSTNQGSPIYYNLHLKRGRILSKSPLHYTVLYIYHLYMVSRARRLASSWSR